MTNSSLVRQASFAGGEIAPLAYGRTESDAYKAGLRLALNFIPTLEGPIVNRPGTRYVCAVKDATYTPRLEAFDFTDGQTFVLEVGNLYIRFVQSGAQVLNGGVPYEVAAPWATADLMRLVFAQSGDIITVTHPSYPPYEIARVSNTNWTVTQVSLTPQTYFAGRPSISTGSNNALLGAAVAISDVWTNAGIYDLGQFVLSKPLIDPTRYHLYQSKIILNLNNDPGGAGAAQWNDCSFLSAITYRKGDYAWNPGDNQVYVSLVDLNNANDPASSPSFWVLAADASRPARGWQLGVTQVYSDNLGVNHETSISSLTPLTEIAAYSDRQAQIIWSGEGVGPAKYQVLSYNIYAGRNGIFGYIGTTPAGTRTFSWDGLPPDYGTQPPRGTNPFDVATGAGTKTQSWPGVVAYHEQRALYARSNLRPQDFWGSAVGQPKNFDVNTPVQDSDAFNFKPASERLEEIRSILSLRYALIFTSSGVFGAYGPAGSITPTSISLRRYLQQGASYLKPLPLERAALFVTTRGRVRDLNWDWRSDMYVGRDVSLIARHLFDRRTVVDWAYAETPYSLVWAVRGDGVLLSLTYDPAGVAGWAQHTTAGVFERVESVAEVDASTGATEDAVYFVVRRRVNGANVRYIERMSSRLLPERQVVNADLTSTFTFDARLCNFLDAGLQYDGRGSQLASPPNWTLAGASFNDGDHVTATATSFAFITDNGVSRGFAAQDIGAELVLDPEGTLGVGPLEMRIVGVTDALNATVELIGALPAAYQNTPINGIYMAFAAATLNGLSHLEGASVAALIDGAVSGPFVVTGGSVALDRPAVIVQIGLAYNSDLDLLDIAADQVKTNVKSVRKATFEVVASRGLLVGETLDDATKLFAPQLQEVAGGNTVPGLTTGNAEVTTSSSWNQGGRACLRQSDPLPLSITAVVREVVLGGR